ncbi:MAG: N-acetyltransferase family protein [Actinomycetota bacterium]
MRLLAREATLDDLPTLVELYRSLEKEMAVLHPMWPRADGLAEPVEKTLEELISDPDQRVLVGEIEGIPLGLLYARRETLLPQARGEIVGSIRLVFTHPDAREVGLAEVMRDTVMDLFREEGLTKFDAHVLPGHRLAKNFFEAGGFSARSIVMHHDDEPYERPGRDPRRL